MSRWYMVLTSMTTHADHLSDAESWQPGDYMDLEGWSLHSVNGLISNGDIEPYHASRVYLVYPVISHLSGQTTPVMVLGKSYKGAVLVSVDNVDFPDWKAAQDDGLCTYVPDELLKELPPTQEGMGITKHDYVHLMAKIAATAIASPQPGEISWATKVKLPIDAAAPQVYTDWKKGLPPDADDDDTLPFGIT